MNISVIEHQWRILLMDGGVQFVHHSSDVAGCRHASSGRQSSAVKHTIFTGSDWLCASSRPERTRAGHAHSGPPLCGTWHASRDAYRAALLYGGSRFDWLSGSLCHRLFSTIMLHNRTACVEVRGHPVSSNGLTLMMLTSCCRCQRFSHKLNVNGAITRTENRSFSILLNNFIHLER